MDEYSVMNDFIRIWEFRIGPCSLFINCLLELVVRVYVCLNLILNFILLSTEIKLNCLEDLLIAIYSSCQKKIKLLRQCNVLLSTKVLLDTLHYIYDLIRLSLGSFFRGLTCSGTRPGRPACPVLCPGSAVPVRAARASDCCCTPSSRSPAVWRW